MVFARVMLAALASELLVGCTAALLMPVAATTYELANDRRASFEKHLNAAIGENIFTKCEPRQIAAERLWACGKYTKTLHSTNGVEYVFNVVPPGCSYSYTTDDKDMIVKWSYVSEPEKCWQFYLQ